MRIAIAGAGDVARYQTEELLKKGIQVVVLSRSDKEWFHRENVEVRLTDYASVDSIAANIRDCDGLVSMILDYSMNFKVLHLNLIDAMLKTKCRRFIPSEYGGDIVKYPDQPMFYYPNHNPVREKLRSLNGEIEYALICCGWLNDYFVESNSRYIKDLDEGFPIDLKKNTAVIPGTGDEGISFISARDLTKCITALFESTQPWEEFIFASGETTTWNRVVNELYKDYKFEVTHLSATDLVQTIIDGSLENDEYKVINAQYQFMSITNALDLPEDKIQAHRTKYFPHIHFRTNAEIVAEAKINPLTKV